jgi:hypothetical protein
MTYSPTIPTALDALSQSQGDIQTNFAQINTIFQLNHVEFNNAVVGDRGKHKQVNLRAVALPVTIAGEGALYVFNTGGAREQLRYRRESNGQEFGLTEWFGGAVRFNGAGVVLGGSIFNVAAVVRNGAGDYTITFTTPLTSANYIVLITPSCGLSGSGVATIVGVNAQTAGNCRIFCKALTNNLGTDPAFVSVLMLGEIS